MAAKSNHRTVYRDSQTGRFVSVRTWRQSRAHGGTRYKRNVISLSAKTGARPTVPPLLPGTGGGTLPTAGGVPERMIIPPEFLELYGDYFESGFETPEEEEYA